MPRHEQNLLLWHYKFALSKYVVNSIRFVGAQISAVEREVDLTARKWRFLQQWLRTVWVLGMWRCVVWYEFASGSAGSAVPILMTDEEAARGSLGNTQGQYLRDVCVRRPPGVSERWGSPWGSLKWRINLTHTAVTLPTTRSAGTSYRHNRYLPRNFGNGTCERTDCATTCLVALGLFIVVMPKKVFWHRDGLASVLKVLLVRVSICFLFLGNMNFQL